MSTILITGATGTVGSALLDRLAGSGPTVRALVRDPSRLERHANRSPIEIAVGDFAEPRSLRAALTGVESVFLACGNGAEQVRFEGALIDEAAAAGVGRIVKLSARGAAVDAPVGFWRGHALIERHLRASGVPAVVLQPSFLMTNLLAATASVRDQGMLFAPAGAARIAMVHPVDVAAVAAETLLGGDEPLGRAYVLTGPAAISYEEVARELSAAVGRQVGYLDVPPEAARGALLASGLPAAAAEQVLAVFAALRSGVQVTTTDVVAQVTGQAPRSWVSFAREHAGAFGARQVLPVGA